VAALLLAALCLRTHGDPGGGSVPAAMAFARTMPQTVLWAWEEPEDLRAAPAASTGVAYLAETILLDTNQDVGKAQAGSPAVITRSRHQPLAVAPGAAVMAVVRIIAQPGFRDSPELREQTADALAEVAQRPGLRALQIDFDATRSQRAFYAAVLRILRPRMPANMPLSITALLSWCAAEHGSGGWLGELPVDEAVPMFFRLGGSARPGDDKSGYTLREPLCQGSVGISTDESWPALNARQRVYLFAPRPWTAAQLEAVDSVKADRRPAALAYDNRGIALHAVNDTGLHAPQPADRENAP
jgi:hypothetical protein